ncbi:hypothetical protein TUN199_06137 [Pyrenophora tritici-repentis]|nr:hypothetical protein Alg130_06403 [Pyrenophora tritici-repentis]KAI0609409.1 hypothetical protein TUN205_06335 [Pyrenophora tritici-repentis]KAI0621862.1 hypothetical protein TUN199_06137 [Pyrenophora tritici-repentis]KAI1538313.1 hypothetical protein PtrSN001C_005771 [Pyrenophora tritici-repentis]PZC94090.1 hypothetical protein A1F95_06835 [Pyrenophora tritici-repentis]
MDPGLSRRSLKVLAAAGGAAPHQQQQWGSQQQHTIDRDGDDATLIDLSRATNEVAHAELLEFFKSTVGEDVTSEGCIISQSSPSLNTALSTLTTPPSTLPSLYLTSLLSWSQLPTLLALTTERLTYSCHILATFLQRHDVEFVVPTHGVVLFARLARTAASKGEEKRFFEALERGGVRVGRGEKG